MPKISKTEYQQIVRTVMEWMIDDYPLSDIISQTMTKWSMTEKEANNVLVKIRGEWIKNEQENNEQKRLRKIESLKKLKRGMSVTDKKTPNGILAMLKLEQELFRLESLSPSKVLEGVNKLPKNVVLNNKQEKFCREYVKDLNGTQAAIRSGYSKKTAGVIATENLQKPNIKKFIEFLADENRKKLDLSAEMIVEDLRALADYNIQDFINSNNSIKDISTISRAQAKPIIGIKTTEKIFPDGSKEIKTELKLSDKRAAAVDLGRHIGIFEKDNKQKSILPTSLSDDQFDQLLNKVIETSSNTGI